MEKNKIKTKKKTQQIKHVKNANKNEDSFDNIKYATTMQIYNSTHYLDLN